MGATLYSYIKRLLKAYIYELKESKYVLADFPPILAWTITSNGDSVIIATLPPLIRDYIFNIRQRLNLSPMEHLHNTIYGLMILY